MGNEATNDEKTNHNQQTNMEQNHFEYARVTSTASRNVWNLDASCSIKRTKKLFKSIEKKNVDEFERTSESLKILIWSNFYVVLLFFCYKNEYQRLDKFMNSEHKARKNKRIFGQQNGRKCFATAVFFLSSHDSTTEYFLLEENEK